MSARSYLLSQEKRALRLMPQMLALTLLLAFAGLLAGEMFVRRADQDTARQKFRIGVVSAPDMPGLSLLASGLQNFDASRFAVEFSFVDEAEARELLRAKELSAYAVIPDDFFASLHTDDIHPVRYVTLSGVSGTTALLASEVAQSVSRLLLETQDALAGARAYAAENLPGTDPEAAERELSDLYARLALSRDRLYRLETLGLAASLSTEGYYFCGIATLFLMLWAISCSPFFSRRSPQLCQMLTVRGVGPARQVLCEFLPFVGLMLFALVFAAGAALIFFPYYGAEMPPLELLVDARGLPVLLAQLLMLCAMAFFLYELEPAAVGGVLLLFFNAAAQGYVCGCFYPYSFFPKGLQLVSSMLPAGVTLRALAGLLSSSEALWLPALGYALLFLLLSVFLRRRALDRCGEVRL